MESVGVLMRLLTPENRELLRIIRHDQPPSVAALARRTGRAQPNLVRTLSKLEALGLVGYRREAHGRRPVTLARPFRVEVDPFSQTDRIVVAGPDTAGPMAAVWDRGEGSGYDEG